MNRLVALLIILLFVSSCTSKKFIDELPYSFEINKTSEYELIEKGMIRDDQFSNNDEKRLYKLNHELYCYVKKESAKLVAMKIWKPTDEWVNNGIKIGMSQEGLIQVLAKNKIDYYITDSEYDDNLFVDRNKLKYWFCFPKEDYSSLKEMKNQLNFIVVNSIEK
jgi:hypothetical protein